jgi:hypothetical protein
MDVIEIQSHIEEIEQNSSLYLEKSFDKRVEVIDFIEFHIIDQLDGLMQRTTKANELLLLKQRAENVRSELEEIDINLFEKLRTNIRAGRYRAQEFKNLVNEYVDFNLNDNRHQEEPDYDSLDVFVNGLFHFQLMPEQTKDLEPEMVYYQKTPARIVFELADKIQLSEGDVFFDLGSGPGQVAILMNLLTGITTKGVELEPAFCDHAKNCVAELNLSNVTFVNADARHTDYCQGTIFFMYTPFTGDIMQNVLETLRKESLLRKIKVITYGPCTVNVALQNWLVPIGSKHAKTYKLTFYESVN